MTSPEFDNSIYDEIGAQEIEIAENVCYENPKTVEESGSKYSNNSTNKCLAIPAVVIAVLALGVLIAACTAFALEIAVLRSKFDK